MKLISEPMSGLFVVTPSLFHDARGWFMESYSKKFWEDKGVVREFVQDNRSFSSFGTLRGLHLQTGKSAQAKLVTCLQGEVLDVMVDLRKDSPTRGKIHTELLTQENKVQVYVPRGFAHGFAVLSPKAEFFYKCDNFYDPASEKGIIFNDSDLKINWQITADKLIVSEKDKKLPTLKEILKMDLGL